MKFDRLKVTPELKKHNSTKKAQNTSIANTPVIITCEKGYTVKDVLNKILSIPEFSNVEHSTSEYFVFMDLSEAQIQILEDLGREGKLKEVDKIWLDQSIEANTIDSFPTIGMPCQTIKGYFEHVEFYKDINWAVLDDGIFKNTPALKGSVVHEVNFTPDTDYTGAHGSHVAGIIAGWWPEKQFRGVAPKCSLFNLKIASSQSASIQYNKTSFVIKGMEWIRIYNSEHPDNPILGANLSWGVPFSNINFQVFAPGMSPICQEANRLVRSGVVLSVSAGNYGSSLFEIENKGQSLQAAVVTSSISDPGTAELPITVGATHKTKPELYGVSLFSSKGPTADGRLKPDLIAPGERILSCWPSDENLGNLEEDSGTSQAAPFVSGAAIQLLKTYPQLRGKPSQIKSILIQSARNIGRNQYFQGKGLIDIARAKQVAKSFIDEVKTKVQSKEPADVC